jgi:hypothetical protein
MRRQEKNMKGIQKTFSLNMTFFWRFKLQGWSFEARIIRARGGRKGVNPTNKHTTAYAPEADVKEWVLQVSTQLRRLKLR